MSRKVEKGTRVGIYFPPGPQFVSVLFSIWEKGGIAVPLVKDLPVEMQRHFLDDAGISIVLTDVHHRSGLETFCPQEKIEIVNLADSEHTAISFDNDTNAPAVMLYTSGTTSKPKGVVLTHGNIQAQIKGLVEAWHWQSDDHLLCVLPLNHVHGLVVATLSALYIGAKVDFLPFDPRAVFDKFLEGKVTVFMGVPTMYYKLIAHYETLPVEEQNAISEALSKLRLMTSGSAALPVSVLERWEKISGHTLLERYGMTEIGIGLTNPYELERRPGHVGQPVPGVSIRIMDDSGRGVESGEPGLIEVQGDNVFSEYWQNPAATAEAFTEDGWFKTGDRAVVEDGYYRILGRDSVDIIKTGGHKVSALEIEEVLRQQPGVDQCAVVGVPDEEWGEIIAIALMGDEVSLADLQEALKGRLPSHMLPRRIMILEDFPRNALGKVIKTDLRDQFLGIS